ncbi:MAG TPA: efflux RND transporter periplasmic adaptor subunit [Isosphaeraceae bacterium]
MRRNPRGPLVLTLSAALVVALAGCERPTVAARAGAGETLKEAAATKVEVVRPVRKAIRRTTEQPGQVEAAEVAPIQAKLSGYTRSVAADIGDRVVKGQVLAELWVPEAEADLQQKRAMVEQAESTRVQAEASIRVAEAGVASAEARKAEAVAGLQRATAERARWQSEFERAGQLARERAVTGSMLDEARSRLAAAAAAVAEAEAAVRAADAARVEGRAQVDKARADLTAAAAGVEVARASARHAEAMLAYARIEAPFDGVVTRRQVDTGHLTVAGTQGEPLFVLARTDVVTVAVAVPETFAAAVTPGDPASIRLQALGARAVEATVTRSSYALDVASRTLRAEIDLKNPDGTLRPGLYATAAIVAEEHPDALTVPATAIARDGAQSFCVVVASGRAARKPVAVGLDDGTDAEILSGLDPRDVVVKANAASLVDGQAVTPVDPPAAPKP